MAETFRLDASGPHSADYTTHVAEALTEAVRVLNHATRASAGVPDPVTVYVVLGRVTTAIAGLDQLLPQLADQLVRLNADSRLTDDNNDPALSLANALIHLDAATAMSTVVARQLAAAHTATSGLKLRDGGQG